MLRQRHRRGVAVRPAKPIAFDKQVFPLSTFSRLAAAIPGGSFAFVMATGIVSIAAISQGLRPIGTGLFAINVAAFAVLSLLMLWRLICDRTALIAEFSHQRKVAGFLTVVAATAVVGAEFVVQAGERTLGAVLWLVACALWVGLIYAVFAVAATRSRKPAIDEGLDGGWLLAAVATESLAVLGSYVADRFARPDIVIYFSLCWFLLGGFFYVIVITLIVYRWLFAPLPPEALGLAYWINMGAMAIATLAGARLETIGSADLVLQRLLPAIAAGTALCWAVASWWIPLLCVLTLWRYSARGRIAVPYRLELWSMVFPLGMYTVATAAFAEINRLDFLFWVPRVMLWIALAAWTASFAAMAWNTGAGWWRPNWGRRSEPGHAAPPTEPGIRKWLR